MNFIKPENSNFTFKAGNNPSTGDLAVTMAFRADIPGRVFGISVWEVSDEDLAEIIRTRKIYLSIMGAGMPPVNVFSHDPFTQHGYYPAEIRDGRFNDPRHETQFLLWLGMIEEEINKREFFKSLSKTPTKHVSLEMWEQIYKSGGSIERVVSDLECWVERMNAKQN